VFYQPVVLKEGDIVYRGLDSEYETEFVVHLYGNRTHGVFYPGSLDSGVEVISHLSFIALVKLSSEEGGDVFRLYRVDGSASEVRIDRLEMLLLLEDDIGCILSLHDAPVVEELELLDDGTKLLGKLIELAMQKIDLEGIREVLGFGEIRDPRKDIVNEGRVNAFFSRWRASRPCPLK